MRPIRSIRAEDIGDLEQVTHIIERVIELGRAQGPVPPVGARFTAGQADSQNLADQIHERERIIETDQTGRDLDVEHLARQGPRAQQADPQILAGRVHDDFDGRVEHHVPERADVAHGQGIDHGEPFARGHLNETEDRLERVFTDKFGVERKLASRRK